MDTFWEIVASNALVVALMALAVSALSRVWKNPQALHLLWLLVLVKLFLPPIVTIGVPVTTTEVAPAPQTPDRTTGNSGMSLGAAVTDRLGNSSVDPNQLTKNDAHSQAISTRLGGLAMTVPCRREFSWRSVLAWVWGIGAAGLAVVYACALLRYERLLRFAQSAPTDVMGMAASVGQRLGLQQIPKIVMLPFRISPSVWAIGSRLRVTLPSELCQQLDAASLRTILAHELAHVRRKDHLVRVLELLTKTLFWWHPVTWWAGRQLRELEEECCDAMVLGIVPGGMKVYATTLLNTLDFLSEGSLATPLGATTIRPAVSLARRIKMLQGNAALRRLTFGHWLLLTGLAGFPLAVGVAATPASGGKSTAAAIQNETSSPSVALAEPAEESPAAEPKQKPGVISMIPGAHTKPLVGENAAGEKVLLQPFVGQDFIIMPITTELQRAAGSKYKHGKVFILINGWGLFNDDNTVLTMPADEFNELASALESIMIDGVRGAAIFRLLMQPYKPDNRDPAKPRWQAGVSDAYAAFLEQRATAWFEENSIERFYGWKKPAEWKSLVEELTKTPPPGTNQDETGVGDEQVMVYPVHTALSRYLFNRDDDCVVHVIPLMEDVQPGILQTIDRAVAQLKLERKDVIDMMWSFKRPEPAKHEWHIFDPTDLATRRRIP